jgi:hypothetical protein
LREKVLQAMKSFFESTATTPDRMAKSKTHPLTRVRVDFSSTAVYEGMTKLIRELELKDGVAFRAGELTLDEWRIKQRAVREIARTGRSLAEMT